MFDTILLLAGGLVLVVATIAIVFIVGMRTKSPLVLDTLIALGKHGFNKIGLRTAGQAGVGTARIHHIGRVSGRTYKTPVGAVPTDDGFLIMLPYGLRSQWLRNVLASGSARLDVDGRSYDVDAPELVRFESVESAFGAADRRASRLLAVRDVLRLRRVETARQPAHGASEGIATAA
jgi:deazaflavin-dependent oxidoreductase (nitroreductase family)